MNWSTLDNMDVGFDPYDYTVTEQIFSSTPSSPSKSGFDTFMGTFNNLLGGGGGGGLFGASNPIGTSQAAGNQLAYNLGQSANTAALALRA